MGRTNEQQALATLTSGSNQKSPQQLVNDYLSYAPNTKLNWQEALNVADGLGSTSRSLQQALWENIGKALGLSGSYTQCSPQEYLEQAIANNIDAALVLNGMPTGCLFWINAGLGVYASGPVLAVNGDSVVQALDQSGNSKTFSQDTAGRYPTYNTNTINGKPVIDYDGTANVLSNAADCIGNGNVTVFAVAKPDSFGGASGGRILNNSKFDWRVLSTNNVFQLSSNQITYAASANNAITTGQLHILAVTRASDGTTNLYLNGAASGTANQSSGAPAGGTATYIGNYASFDRGFDGNIPEVIAFSGILTSAQMNIVGKYLATKYAGTWTGL